MSLPVTSALPVPDLSACNKATTSYPKVTKFDLVHVTWLDSRTPCGAWQWLDELPYPQPTLCHSVGWLVQEGEKAKRIAAHISEDDNGTVQISGDMIIPTVAIVEVRRL